MKISAIAAVAANGVIGKNNRMPWHLPDDLKYFRQRTTDHVIIMGHRCFRSGPFPLPNRINIVLTRNKELYLSGCYIAHSLEEAFEIARRFEDDEVFVIGGATVYQQALPYVQRLYITEIHSPIEGDTFFPDLRQEDWHLLQSIYHPKDDRHPYDFTFKIYERRTSSE